MNKLSESLKIKFTLINQAIKSFQIFQKIYISYVQNFFSFCFWPDFFIGKFKLVDLQKQKEVKINKMEKFYKNILFLF